MTKYAWLAGASVFGLFSLLDVAAALGTAQIGVALLGMLPAFVAGWCAAKASWS